MDVRNAGVIKGLADDDVVELPARVNRKGATPVAQPPVAPELLGLMQHVAAYERLAAEAAVTGVRSLVYKALLAHPLVGQDAVSDELVERLLDAGAEHLPQFRTESRV